MTDRDMILLLLDAILLAGAVGCLVSYYNTAPYNRRHVEGAKLWGWGLIGWVVFFNAVGLIVRS